MWIAALATIAGCSSGGTGGTASPPPANPPGPMSAPVPAPTDVNATGAADGHAAVRAFLDAARAQDLQAFSAVWGGTNGPLRNMVGHDDFEKRELIMMCFLKHDSDSIGTASAAAGSRMTYPVRLTQGSTTRGTTVTTIQGPSSRWYVETVDLRPIEALCQKHSN